MCLLHWTFFQVDLRLTHIYLSEKSVGVVGRGQEDRLIVGVFCRGEGCQEGSGSALNQRVAWISSISALQCTAHYGMSGV